MERDRTGQVWLSHGYVFVVVDRATPSSSSLMCEHPLVDLTSGGRGSWREIDGSPWEGVPFMRRLA